MSRARIMPEREAKMQCVIGTVGLILNATKRSPTLAVEAALSEDRSAPITPLVKTSLPGFADFPA